MKKTLNFLVLLIFWSGISVLMYFVFQWSGLNRLTILIFPFFLVCLSVSLSYKSLWSAASFRSRRFRIAFVSFFLIAFLLITYISSLVSRSYLLYSYLISGNMPGWEGILNQPDDTLGFKPIPNARAFRVFPNVPYKTPVAFDQNGFRIPFNGLPNELKGKPELLFLGCSFTFGDACIAEETFPYIVTKEARHPSINAGVGSYGLSQMLILAERLIPQYKPRYVIVQYSPWLVERGVSRFASINFGRLRNPYFVNDHGTIVLDFPRGKSQVFDIDKKQIQSKYTGKFLNYLFREGAAFYWNEDINFLNLKYLRFSGQLPAPATDVREVERYAYNRIQSIAREHGSTLIVVKISDMRPSINPRNLFSDKSVFVANADSLLSRFVKQSASKNYAKEFHHWTFNGKDSVEFDKHPNAKAHSLIARSILNVLEQINRR